VDADLDTATSKPPSPTPDCTCCARPAKANPNEPAPDTSNHCGRSYDTFKGQLDLEAHGGHTPAGVIVRI
jgi:hypothetical protein